MDTSSTTQMAEIMGNHWRSRGGSWTKFVRSSINRIAMGKTIRRSFIKTWMVTTTKLGMSVGPSTTRINLLGIRGWHQNGWKEAEYGSHVGEITEKTLILKNQHHFFTIKIWDVFNVNAKLWNIDKTIYKDVRITNFCWSNWKITGVGQASRKNGCVVLRHGRTCSRIRWKILRIGEEKDRAAVQSFTSLPSCSLLWVCSGFTMLQKLNSQKEELEPVWELSDVCSQIVVKCLNLARIGWPEIFWTANKLVRSVTKWTRACDRRLARLISCIHRTSDYRQYCHVLTLLVTLRTQLTSGAILYISGSRTFVHISWMCKEQTSLPHRSTAAEKLSRCRFVGDFEDSVNLRCNLVHLWKSNICSHKLDVQGTDFISTPFNSSWKNCLDAGLRMDGITVLDLWDLVIEVFLGFCHGSVSFFPKPIQQHQRWSSTKLVA